LIKYIGKDKERYDRLDFEQLMLNKYCAKKLSSRNELKEYYIKTIGGISDLERDIKSFSEGNINSELYDIYLIEDSKIIDTYFFTNGRKKSTFAEIYVEYDNQNNIISSYFRSDYSHIYIEINYFFAEKDRRPPMIIRNWIKPNK
jgi:hypothetical protein